MSEAHVTSYFHLTINNNIKKYIMERLLLIPMDSGWHAVTMSGSAFHAAECCTKYAHNTHTCRSVGCTRDTGSTDDSDPSHCWTSASYLCGSASAANTVILLTVKNSLMVTSFVCFCRPAAQHGGICRQNKSQFHMVQSVILFQATRPIKRTDNTYRKISKYVKEPQSRK